LELTFSTQSIATASKAAQFLSQSDDVLSKPRGAESPYRIRNQTGFPIHVWADTDNSASGTMAKRLEDGEEVPWRVEEWEKMREVGFDALSSLEDFQLTSPHYKRTLIPKDPVE